MKKSIKLMIITLGIVALFTGQNLFAASDNPQGASDQQNQMNQQQEMQKSDQGMQQSSDQGMQSTSQDMLSSQEAPGQAQGSFKRASNLMEKNVVGSDGEELGSISDIIMDSNGKAEYIVISKGGLLGVGGQMVPIPWNQVSVSQGQEGKTQIQAQMTKQDLENAPSFAKNELDNFGQHQQEVRGYFQDKSGGQQQDMQKQGQQGMAPQDQGASPEAQPQQQQQ